MRITRLLPLLILLTLFAPYTSQAATFSDQKDVVFAQRDKMKLRMDIRWNSEVRDAPIVILLHGGGWWFGTRRDLTDVVPVATNFVSKGFVAISIDYRLACSNNDTHRKRYGELFQNSFSLCGAYIPDQVQDVHDAIRFAKEHAADWGANPDKTTLLGASAGGHLALLAAATAPSDARVNAVVNWSGPSSTSFITVQPLRPKPNIRPSFTNAVGCMWQSNTSCKKRWNMVNPLFRVNALTQPFAVLAVSGEKETQVPAVTHNIFDAKLKRLGFISRVISLNSDCHGAGCRTLMVRSKNGRKVQSVEATSIAFLAAHSTSDKVRGK